MKRIDAACPCCGKRELAQFYAVDSVPVNSCRPVDTAEAEGEPIRAAICGSPCASTAASSPTRPST